MDFVFVMSLAQGQLEQASAQTRLATSSKKNNEIPQKINKSIMHSASFSPSPSLSVFPSHKSFLTQFLHILPGLLASSWFHFLELLLHICYYSTKKRQHWVQH